MKKILLILGIFMLCGFTPKIGNLNTYITDQYNEGVVGKVVMVDDMRILILTKNGRQCSPVVINLTKDKIQIEKDKLEIELLKKQLNKK